MQFKKSTIKRAVTALTAALTLGFAACIDAGGGGGAGQSGVNPSDLAGSGASADANGPVTGEIEFWTINLRKNYQAYFEGLIKDFETQHEGVKINWVDVPGKEMQTKYLAAVAAGNIPDVVNIDAKNFGQLALTLTDHAPFFTKDELSAYQPGLIEGLTIQGTLYAIPWYNSGTLIGVYRKSIVDQVGFDPKNPPKTWEEVLELADKIHKKTGVHGTNADPNLRVLQAMGVKFIDEDLTTAQFATEEAAAKLKLFQEAYKSGAIAPGATAEDTEEPQTIENGLIAFKADYHPGRVKRLEENAPDAYNDIYVTTAPRTVDGKDQLPGQMGLSIPQGSDNKVTAAAFIKFLTAADAQLEFCKQVPIFPSTIATLEDPYFTDNPGVTPEEQARKLIVENFGNTVDTTVPLPASVPDQLRQDFIRAMKAAMRSGEDPLKALQAQQEIWQKALDAAAKGN